ncbi:hypothetical protein NL676_004688 [Syzygium grande]|nr:hypothetical protein NL676_004688 [Syzygium grande]
MPPTVSSSPWARQPLVLLAFPAFVYGTSARPFRLEVPPILTLFAGPPVRRVNLPAGVADRERRVVKWVAGFTGEPSRRLSTRNRPRPVLDQFGPVRDRPVCRSGAVQPD